MAERDEVLVFLQALMKFGEPQRLTRKHLPPATHEQDKARQHSRRAGWASYWDSGWTITAAGQEELARREAANA